MSIEFDPKKIIDFSKDYYGILGLSKEELPKGKSRDDKVHLSKMLEVAFRKKARVCHPDFGGSNEAFLDIVRARRIIEDPMLKKVYDQGYFDEFNVQNVGLGLDVDWTKIGTYRKGTPEDTIGFGIFLKLCEQKEELGLTPAFFPESNEHNYEWDWVINEMKTKLALSIVNDESEVLRLTSGSNIEDSLPFKIYLCIPRANLILRRDHQEIMSPFGKTLVNGVIQQASYSDVTFLETTRLEEAHQYIENEFKQDLSDYLEGKNLSKFISDRSPKNTNWMNSQEMKKFDQNILNSIINMRAFEIIDDEKAADFLDNLPE